MAEYVEREAVLSKAQLACRIALLDEDPEQCDVDFSDEFAVSVDDIVEIPAADVAPVVHGRWEFIGDDYANCTNCGTVFEARPTPYFFEANNKFCRSCGAKMKDGE